MGCFDTPEIRQLEKVLEHCGNYGNCDKCDLDWMEDHGMACYRRLASDSILYIKALKEVIDTYDRKIDELMEAVKNG